MSVAPSEQLTPNPSGWEYGPEGRLQETDLGSMQRAVGGAATELLRQPGEFGDKDMAHTIALEVNTLFDANKPRVARLQYEIQTLESRLAATDNPSAKSSLEVAIARLQTTQESLRSPAALSEQQPVIDAVNNELAQRERASIEKIVSDRIEQDRYPWTMPNAEIPNEEVQNMRDWHELITHTTEEAQDGDEFRVPYPMTGDFCEEDVKLFADIGVPIGDRWGNITRKELRDAGVFFVNRVGGGEQPIFGISIPDPESPNGILELHKRAFLTRKEFQKVYDYQQANGYGLGGADPADVQTDMIIFAVKPTAQERNRDMHTKGSSGRDDKYGIARSPFVDSPFRVRAGVLGPTVSGFDGGKTSRRMNTFTMHLVNGHPDYPGVSEMFDRNTTAPDQCYMSPAEYARELYVAPPTRAEALIALQTGLPTKREHIWVGKVEAS